MPSHFQFRPVHTQGEQLTSVAAHHWHSLSHVVGLYIYLALLVVCLFTPSQVFGAPRSQTLPPGITSVVMGTTFTASPDCEIVDPRSAPLTYPVGTSQIAFQIMVDVAMVQSVNISIDKSFGGVTLAQGCNKYTVYQGQPRQVQWGSTIRRADNAPLPPDTYTMSIFINGSSQPNLQIPFTITAQVTATPTPTVTAIPTDTPTPVITPTATPTATPTTTDIPVNRWQSIGPDGGTVNALAIDPLDSATLYAGTGNGVFKSSDAGQSWRASNDNLGGSNVTALLIDSTTPSTVYAGTHDGVFKSTDGGTSWIAMNQGLFGFVETLASDPSNQQVLYAGGFDVRKSSDGAETWSALAPVTTTSSILSIAVDPVTPSLLYAGTYVGLFRSMNGGQAWQPLTNGIPAESRIHQIVIHPNEPSIIYLATINGIYKSTNKGDSWTQLLQDWVVHLVINRQNPAILYAGTANGIFKSTNNGSSWSAIGQGLPAKGSSALASAPQDPMRVYFAQFGVGIFKSGDGGATWSESNRGLIATGIAAFVIDPSTPSTLYAGTNSGTIFKSMDRGSTWHLASAGLDTGQICGRNAIAIDPQKPSTLYAGTRQGIFKSLDGGATWSNIFDVFFIFRCVVSLAVDPASSNNVYLGLGSQFYRSTDGGATWQLVTAGLPNNDQIALDAIHIDPKVPTTLYLGTDAGVYKSTNRGSDWQAINKGLPDDTSVTLLVTHPQTNTIVYAGSNQGLYVSPNSGQDWMRLPLFQTIRGLVLHPQKPALFFAANDAGVHYSLDAGDTWYPYGEGLPALPLSTLVMDPIAPEILYAGTEYGGVFQVRVNDSTLVPFTITVQPVDQTILSGQGATLAVTVSGSAPATYQWYQGTQGDTSIPVSGATAATFTTSPLMANSSFWVRVANAGGRSVDSTSATITVVTHLNVSAPPTATVGRSFTVSVAARDSANAIATGYRGTINFASGDGGAALPNDYTFKSEDIGVHSFSVTLETKGNQSLTIRDVSASAVQGSVTIAVELPDSGRKDLYLPILMNADTPTATSQFGQ
jgi:photosystem II stability/assembly factor-like uncharacterized protein